MRLVFSKKSSKKEIGRAKKKVRIRKKLSGTDERPRLCVFRSSKHIYASVVNDTTGATLVSFSSLKVSETKSGNEMAKFIGAEVAKLAIAKDIKSVVFDRNGYLYHGRVKSVADGAREAGLNF
jgi:large subunit ribosomal protein L18